MCLDKILKYEKPVTEGYKIFIKTNDPNKLSQEYYGKEKEIGKWYHAQAWWRRLLCLRMKGEANSNDDKYELGFHVFHSLDDANHWLAHNQVVAKVLVEDPICVGRQYGHLIIVARKMKIVEVIR